MSKENSSTPRKPVYPDGNKEQTNYNRITQETVVATTDKDQSPNTSDDPSIKLSAVLSRLSIGAALVDKTVPKSKALSDLSFKGLLDHWKQHGFQKIITMVGAGISTSAGIPDFRSPGSGIYNNLKKYNLPSPTHIFELDYFIENPKPFFTLAKELYPGSFIPTPSHYFIRLLNEKNLLIRHYTQNIDSLERIAGIPEEKLVEAHGTFHTNHCLKCGKLYSKEWMKKKIFNDELPLCEKCGGIVKPDIIFFGENLPDRFYEMPAKDFKDCDILIIMGTSLEVYPFASLTNYVDDDCVRVLINRNAIYKFESPNNTRDISFIGDCDVGVWQIAEALGWREELKALIDRETEKLQKHSAQTADKKTLDEGERESSKSSSIPKQKSGKSYEAKRKE